MGTIHKIGDDYYIEFYARGLRYQRNGGKNKAKAKSLLKDIESQIRNGELSIVDPNIETEKFLNDFLDFAQCEYGVKTFSRYELVIKDFRQFCCELLPENSKLSLVTPSVVESYRAHLLKETVKTPESSVAFTINLTLLLLKDILDHAINLGYLNDNPALHTHYMDMPDHENPEIMTDDEVKDLLEDSSGVTGDRICMLLHTGIRIEELIGLQWSKVDFQHNYITIELSPDCSSQRQIPMDHAVLTVMKRLKEEGQNCKYVFHDLKDQQLELGQVIAEIESMTQQKNLNNTEIFHIFRNTFAANVLKKGVSLVNLSRLMGLEDIAQVMRYFRFVNQ